MKKIIQRLFRRFGFEIHRTAVAGSVAYGSERTSLEGSLRQARRAGFVPATVIDVGAAMGSFSRTCHAIFPEAHYVLIEPLREYLPALRQLTQDVPRASYEIAAAAAVEQVICINVHQDLVGSSLYREVEEGTDVNGVPREVRAITLDRVVSENKAVPPYLVKIDVQGAELDVLAGGQTVLHDAGLVVLEVSMFQFFQRGPLFSDVVEYMRSKGFVAYDVLGLQYRPLDLALSQLDIVFVKETGQLRRFHYYATPEQRRMQNDHIRSHCNALLSAEQHP